MRAKPVLAKSMDCTVERDCSQEVVIICSGYCWLLWYLYSETIDVLSWV
jgi:hypothetical protein